MKKASQNINLFSDTAKIWDAIFRDCESAKEFIIMQQYILEDDDIGNKFLHLMKEKAQQGVAICILLDKIGARQIYDHPAIQTIRSHGGVVEFYNNINIWHLFMPWRWLPRNHIKLFIIDGKIAYIGGAGIANYMHDWYDIMARITGPAVKIFGQKSFPIHKKEGDVCNVDFHAASDQTIDGLRYHLSNPSFPTSQSYQILLDKINNATTSIQLVTPYFLPPKRLKWALKNAADRGVEVRLIITEKTDSPVTHMVSHSYFPRLLRHGINIHAYNENHLCHAKYVIIDDEWAMMGSTNLDYLSLIYNREGNLFTENKDMIATMKTIFENTLKDCTPVHQTTWASKPWYKKVIGYGGRLFKKVM